MEKPVPLGLRAGSQRVTHGRTAIYFEQALRWIDSLESHIDFDHELAEALSTFRELDEEIHRLEEARHVKRSSDLKGQALDARILDLDTLLGHGAPPKAAWCDGLSSAAASLKRLAPRLDSLLRRLETDELVDAHRIWKKTDWNEVESTRPQLREARIDGLDDIIVRWEIANDGAHDAIIERVEAAIDRLDAIRDTLQGLIRQRRLWEQLVDLRAERAQLCDEAPQPTIANPADLARCHHQLFQQPIVFEWHGWPCTATPSEKRSRWSRSGLEQRSIKRLLDQDVGSGRWIKHVFPARVLPFCHWEMFCRREGALLIDWSSMKADNAIRRTRFLVF